MRFLEALATIALVTFVVLAILGAILMVPYLAMALLLFTH
jgi:hypothetical protein